MLTPLVLRCPDAPPCRQPNRRDEWLPSHEAFHDDQDHPRPTKDITPVVTARGAWTGAEGKSAMRFSAPLMSEEGLVSRVSPVQTALRNCTRDEGRSFEVGNQVLI
jgi:hypothetical protein